MYKNRFEKYAVRTICVIVALMFLNSIFEMGKEYALENMIVTNAEHEEGHYIVSLDEDTYYYWYE